MLLSIQEVARELNVSKGSVYALVAQGRLPHLRIGNGRGIIRIKPDDLARFVEGQRRDACGDPPSVPHTPLEHLRFRAQPR